MLVRRSISSTASVYTPSQRLKISFPSLLASTTPRKPIIVFTAGAPGSGKTYCLHHIFGLDNVEMVDLDEAMKQHPNFDNENQHVLYENPVAYSWANEKVEERFQELLASPPQKLVCVDGTGTHVERQIRRLQQAKNAGFWCIKLYVKVKLDTALSRNARRERQVPEDILSSYVSELDEAVDTIIKVPNLIDEFIEFNNDDDDGINGRERWGENHYDQVWVNSVSRGKGIYFPKEQEEENSKEGGEDNDWIDLAP